MQNLIFDLDGTLLDTETMYMRALQAVLHERGINRPYAELTATFGIPSRDALVRLQIPDLENILTAWGDRTVAYQDTVSIYPGVRTALAKLREVGTNLAIMTSKRRFEYERDVVSVGLDQYFKVSVVAEDVDHGKPAPDGILLAMQRLGADPASTVYVGDTAYDYTAAHAAGVDFGFAGWNGKTPVNYQPDRLYTTPGDLLIH